MIRRVSWASTSACRWPSGVQNGGFDRRPCDLVENEPRKGTFGLRTSSRCHAMASPPGRRRRKVHDIGFSRGFLEGRYMLLLFGVNDVDRLESIACVHP